MSMMKYNAVFVISSLFPYGEAFSSRARNIIKLLNVCDYKVYLVAPKSKSNTVCSELVGFEYEATYVEAPRNMLTLSGIGTAKPYMEAIKKIEQYVKIDILISSAMVHVSDALYNWSRTKQIPYILEQCEWYDASTFKGGKFNPYYHEHIKLIEKKNRRVDGIIAISALFEKHYKAQNVPTLRMPTILDIPEVKYSITREDKDYINIVFAGSLGKGKENFYEIIKALKIINEDSVRLILDIYGATRDQLNDNLNGAIELLDNTEKFLRVHGKIPQVEVNEKLMEADFSIFIRPKRKSSDAGFPTKLAESMSVGTPVITNNTGDISLYLENGINGFMTSDNTLDSIVDIFKRVTQLTSEELTALREQARRTAEEHFSYENYKEAFLNLVNLATNRVR